MGTSGPRPFAVPAEAPIDPPETPNTNLVTAARDGKHRPVIRNARRAAASSEFALMLLVEG